MDKHYTLTDENGAWEAVAKPGFVFAGYGLHCLVVDPQTVQECHHEETGKLVAGAVLDRMAKAEAVALAESEEIEPCAESDCDFCEEAGCSWDAANGHWVAGS